MNCSILFPLLSSPPDGCSRWSNLSAYLTEDWQGLRCVRELPLPPYLPPPNLNTHFLLYNSTRWDSLPGLCVCGWACGLCMCQKCEYLWCQDKRKVSFMMRCRFRGRFLNLLRQDPTTVSSSRARCILVKCIISWHELWGCAAHNCRSTGSNLGDSVDINI